MTFNFRKLLIFVLPTKLIVCCCNQPVDVWGYGNCGGNELGHWDIGNGDLPPVSVIITRTMTTVHSGQSDLLDSVATAWPVPTMQNWMVVNVLLAIFLWLLQWIVLVGNNIWQNDYSGQSDLLDSLRQHGLTVSHHVVLDSPRWHK